MNVVPDAVADANNKMDNEIFGLGEMIRILRAQAESLRYSWSVVMAVSVRYRTEKWQASMVDQ